jgi:glutathione S-transferase
MAFERRDLTMSLTFYYHPHSTAAVTLWELTELGTPHEKVKLDLSGKRDQDRPEFRALNPNGKVPVIVHDGIAIFESAAITMYLGEQFGVARGIYPEPGPRRGEAMTWIVWTNVTLVEAFSRWWRNTVDRFPAEQRNAATAEAAKGELAQLLGILEQSLAGKSWLVGNAFTLVDLHTVCFISYFKMCGLDLAPYPNIAAWIGRTEARPSHAAFEAAAAA